VFEAQRPFGEDGVRATTAFNRLLALAGARVIDVILGMEGIVVRVALTRRRLVCSRCGQVYRATYDSSFRRWRHLDVAGRRCFIEYELRRVECRDCGVRVEAVPWARPDARHTRDFENLVAFCAQQMAKSQVQALLRIAWDTVGRIIERVVSDHLDDRRLARLVQVGCDELSYRRGQRYLTNVADHATGRIVWSRPGRNAPTLQAFFDELGERKDSIKAISIDMSGGYEKAIRAALPDAQIAFDPFHVVALAGRAVDDVRREEWNAKGKSRSPEGKWIKNVRWALRKAPESLTDRQRVALAQVQQTNARLYRAYLLKEQLRALYHLDDPAHSPEHLDAWLAWASRSKLKPFIRLARTLRRYRDGILAAVTLGLTNARLEGLHSKVRLLSHRSFGFHSAAPLIALIYLCCASVTINPPLR
jgi:transposase